MAPLACAIVLSCLMIFPLSITFCLDKIKLLEVYKMISNPKVFFMLQPRGDVFHFNELDLERYGTSANTSKHLTAEAYIMCWQHKQQ